MTVVFDLFGTLTDWQREARRQALCDELADVLGADRDAFRTVRYLVAPSSDALAALGALRAQGRRIGILSDCSSETPELWPTLPYADLVDAAVFSFDVGTRKPDRRMYVAVADALGVEPEDCLYVGDGSSHELTGAEAAGMTAVMFDACPDPALQYDRDEAWAGARVTSLLDVARLPS